MFKILELLPYYFGFGQTVPKPCELAYINCGRKKWSLELDIEVFYRGLIGRVKF